VNEIDTTEKQEKQLEELEKFKAGSSETKGFPVLIYKLVRLFVIFVLVELIFEVI